MMKPYKILLASLGALAFLWLATILPRTTTELFASPDETAVMVFARAWMPAYGFRLPHRLPKPLEDIASLHPRSMVRQADWLVPVGFLGMPFIVMLVESLVRGYGAYLTALLILSAAYPLWRMARRSGPRVAALTVLLTLTFPTVILYANRGLFPNLPVVALTIWSMWAWQALGSSALPKAGSRREELGPSARSARSGQAVMYLDLTFLRSILAGLALGLALTIRPTEALWLLPWIALAIWSGRETKVVVWKAYGLALAAAILVGFGGLWLSYQTYPAESGWLPAIGYQLRDSLSQTTATTDNRNPAAAIALPFGFHPRVMWENVRIYLLTYLGPWTAAALVGAFVTLRKQWGRRETVFLAVSGWTTVVLLMIYGQSLYTDNIRGTVSLGNSFLRYLLPLVPLIAYVSALLIDFVWRNMRRGRLLATILTAFFILYGSALAWAGDEESLLNTQRELRRYGVIRAQAERVLPPGTVILSERSDKIFTSGPFVSVSPIPDKVTMSALLQSGIPIALFHRKLTPDQTLNLIGDLPEPYLLPLFESDNEAMYLLNR